MEVWVCDLLGKILTQFKMNIKKRTSRLSHQLLAFIKKVYCTYYQGLVQTRYWFHRFSTGSSPCYNFERAAKKNNKKLWSETNLHNITLQIKVQTRP